MNPSEFRSILNDPIPHRLFWSDPGSFTPQQFEKNSERLTHLNYPISGFIFILNFLLVFVFFVICIFLTASSSDIHFHVSKSSGWGYLISLIFVLFDFCIFNFVPEIYSRFEIYIHWIISAICLIVGLIDSNWSLIGVFIFQLIIGFWAAFLPFGNFVFTKLLIIQSNQQSTHSFSNCILLLAFLFGVSIYTIFDIYIIAAGILKSWNGIFYFYLIVSYWWTINTFENCLYMIQAKLTAHSYFVDGVSGLTQFDEKFTFAVRRGLFYNIGTAAHAAFILPFLDPFRSIAKLDLNDESVKNASSISKLHLKIIQFIRPQSIEIARRIDRMSHSCREGLYY
jgi:hypothetical protein